MTLATRCSACGTVFRVVQDQLKVSEGWVRCGRCQEVFNALEALFDLDRDAVPVPPPTAPVATLAHEDDGAVGADTLAESRMTTQFETSAGDDAPTTASESQADSEAGDDGDFADARFNLDLIDADEAEQAALAEAEQQAAATDAEPADSIAEVEPPDAGAQAEPAAAPVEPASASAMPAPAEAGRADDDSAADLPAFMQVGGRAEAWGQPRARHGLAAVAALLMVSLALQFALHFRDALAARGPAWQAPLAALCDIAGCTLEPPRVLAALSVDGSGLARAAEPGGPYRFSLVLRNRADHAVAMPAVELALTDGNGELVSRRVLRPADFGSAAPRALAAGAEAPLQLLLASDARITGYAVELFYP